MKKSHGKGKMSDKVDVGAVVGKVLAVAVTIFNRVKKLPASSLMTTQDAWGFAEWLSKDVPDAELNEMLRRLYKSFIFAKNREAMEKKEKQRLESLEYSYRGKGTWDDAVQTCRDHSFPSIGWRLPTEEELKYLANHGASLDGESWSNFEINQDLAVSVKPAGFSQRIPKATILWIILVREKSKRMTVDLETQVARLLEDSAKKYDLPYSVGSVGGTVVPAPSGEKQVKCDGDPDYHKCEERGCPHRLQHAEMEACAKSPHNSAHGWCPAPGTKSQITRGEEDGGLVTCVPVK